MRRKNSTGLLVLVGALAEMHLPEVGGELGLLVAAAGHVRVRRDHLAPGLEAAGRRALDRRAGALALLAAHLLVEAQRAAAPSSSCSTSSACGAETAVSSRASGVERAVRRRR